MDRKCTLKWNACLESLSMWCEGNWGKCDIKLLISFSSTWQYSRLICPDLPERSSLQEDFLRASWGFPSCQMEHICLAKINESLGINISTNAGLSHNKKKSIQKTKWYNTHIMYMQGLHYHLTAGVSLPGSYRLPCCRRVARLPVVCRVRQKASD